MVSKAKLDAKSNTDEGLLRFFNAASVKQESDTVPEFEEVTDEPAVDSEPETVQLVTETTKDAQVPAAVHVDELQDVMDTISAVVGEASQEDIAVRAAKRRAEEAMSLVAADAANKRLHREHGSEVMCFSCPNFLSYWLMSRHQIVRSVFGDVSIIATPSCSAFG